MSLPFISLTCLSVDLSESQIDACPVGPQHMVQAFIATSQNLLLGWDPVFSIHHLSPKTQHSAWHKVNIYLLNE